MKVSEVIREAMTHVEAGWCRFALEDDQGNVCERGAVARAVFGEATAMMGDINTFDPRDVVLHTQTGCALQRALLDLDGTYSISHFNDVIARDKQDVLNHMEKVALTYEERGE